MAWLGHFRRPRVRRVPRGEAGCLGWGLAGVWRLPVKAGGLQKRGEPGRGCKGCPSNMLPTSPWHGLPLAEQTSSCPPLGSPLPTRSPTPSSGCSVALKSRVAHLPWPRFSWRLCFLHQTGNIPGRGDTASSSIRWGASSDRDCFPPKVGRDPRWGWFSPLLCVGLPTSLSRERIREPRRAPPHLPLSLWGPALQHQPVPPPRIFPSPSCWRARDRGAAGQEAAPTVRPCAAPL